MDTKLSLNERLSYGAGNFGVNLIFGLTGAYLMYFYTDVYMIAPAVVAQLFLLARGVDAIFDPLLGLAIDRTKTRWGKHRPYLLWFAIPFALFGVAVFWAPDLTGGAKLAYIYITYTVVGLLYSCLSLPLNSMLPTLTRDVPTRNTTNAIREFMGSAATVGVGYATMPLVAWLGGADQKTGFLLCAAMLAVLTLAGIAAAFFGTRERVEPDSSPQQLTTAQSLKATRGNWPWIATMAVNLCFWIGFIGHVQSTVYYARDVAGQAEWVAPLMAMMLVVLAGTACSAYVANRIGKPATGIIGAAIAAIATAIIPLSGDFGWLMAMNAIGYFGLGLLGGLLFALMADAVDYGEWKSGFRAQGFLFAASSFGVKLGMSIGGAAGAYLLSAANYTAGAPADAAVITAIKWSHAWLPALSYVAMGASLLLFRFDPAYPRASRA
ncbi:MFS transporter [Novosphingobium sp. FSY-8]|uniref:MFS transporter n=1 Tax=Novosphingobium ovatum TaxID=1908523 RepID=A0ABW9XH49_9SPHN|nr:glycoside-pentoside-hexuronide (GPH):cation symporter [Novosphingobium ovatum]NBC37872.1 MFS transporter [Novosphingobium ovatum]